MDSNENFFSYLSRAARESVVEDSTISLLKAPLDAVFPDRIRKVRSLIDFIPPQRAKEIIAEGVALIKTIPSEEDHKKICNYLLKVFRGLETREHLIRYLMRLGGVDEERAEMIANDQIDKAAMRFLVEKWKAQGCKRVRWVHMGDANPRQYHLRPWNGVSGKRNGRPNGLNGYEFDIDKPPVINLKTKERGYPGHMINCHCTLIPLWD